jgi:hypothetical protein
MEFEGLWVLVLEVAIETRFNGIVSWSWSSRWPFYDKWKKMQSVWTVKQHGMKIWGGWKYSSEHSSLGTRWWVVRLYGQTSWTPWTERQVSRRVGFWVGRTACPDAPEWSDFPEVTHNSILSMLHICWHNSLDCLNGRVLHLATYRPPLPDLMDIRPWQVSFQAWCTTFRAATDTRFCNGGWVAIFSVSPKHLFLQRFLKWEALSRFYEHFTAPLEVPLPARTVTRYDRTVEIVWGIYYPLVLSLKVIM